MGSGGSGNWRLSLTLGSLFLLVVVVHGDESGAGAAAVLEGCAEPMNKTFPLATDWDSTSAKMENWCKNLSSADVDSVKGWWTKAYAHVCPGEVYKTMGPWIQKLTANWNRPEESICRDVLNGTNSPSPPPPTNENKTSNENTNATIQSSTTVSHVTGGTGTENSSTEKPSDSSPGATTEMPASPPTPEPIDESDNSLYWIVPLIIVLLILLAFVGFLIHRYTKTKGYQNSVKTPAGDHQMKNEGSNV